MASAWGLVAAASPCCSTRSRLGTGPVRTSALYNARHASGASVARLTGRLTNVGHAPTQAASSGDFSRTRAQGGVRAAVTISRRFRLRKILVQATWTVHAQGQRVHSRAGCGNNAPRSLRIGSGSEAYRQRPVVCAGRSANRTWFAGGEQRPTLRTGRPAPTRADAVTGRVCRDGSVLLQPAMPFIVRSISARLLRLHAFR